MMVRNSGIGEHNQYTLPGLKRQIRFRCLRFSPLTFPKNFVSIELKGKHVMEQIKTERLTLRRFRQGDSAELFAYLSDLQVIRYETYSPFSFAQAQSEAERRRTDPSYWAVCLTGGRLIGEIRLEKGDFGNWTLDVALNRKFWDYGYAFESVRALMEHAFADMGVRRIVASCNAENGRGWRLMEKLGMRREGTRLQDVCFQMDENGRPVFQDTYDYAILRPEWTAFQLTERQKPVFLGTDANLARFFEVPRGVTAFVGGGGKTTSMLRMAEELGKQGTVIVTTTTHIFPPEGIPLLENPDEIAIRQRIRPDILPEPVIAVGVTETKTGKLTPCGIPVERLAELADYVLVEADGAKGKPLKAPASHEPVLPACTKLVIGVAGMDGVGKPIAKAAFRPALYGALLGCDGAHVVTPADAARVLSEDGGQHKGVLPGMRYAVILNKADDEAARAAAEMTARSLDLTKIDRVAVTAYPAD